MVAPLLLAGVQFLAPLIAKAFASPVVQATAASFVAKTFGLDDSTVEGIANFLNGLKPDDQIRLKLADDEFKKFIIEQDNKIYLAELGLIQGQIEVNKIEAAHESIFVAGWRPFVGWVCGTAFAYCAIVEPVLRFIATVVFSYKGTYPAIDTVMTLQVLTGMLGFAYMRSQEKRNTSGK